MYRKVAMAQSMDCIAIRGDGGQTRSFIYIDECVDGMTRLLRSDFSGAVNIGSEEMVTINQLVDTIADIASKQIQKRHVDGPLRVGGRTSDNRLVRDTVGWAPERSLREGLAVTYAWIEKQLENDEHCLKC
jgi:nucleoside-diphosphate-sugar epimerase